MSSESKYLNDQYKGFFEDSLSKTDPELYKAISDTARYGGLKVGDYLIDDEYEMKLKKVLSDIKTGAFKKDLEKNIDNKSYTSTIDSRHIEEFSNIMNVLFEKNKNS